MTDNHRLIKRFLYLAAVIAGVIAFTVVMLAWRISREKGCGVSEERLFRPLKVCSSFGSRRVRPPEELASILKLPVFPQANGIEDSLWLSLPPYGALSALDLHSSSRLNEVELWYANALGSSFQKQEGACAALSLSGQIWTQRLLEGCVGTGILFLAGDEKQSTGVLLSSQGIPEGCEIRLFFHARTRSAGSSSIGGAKDPQ
jgi:hypothetical protein